VGNSDVLVQIDPSLYYYPDVSLICDPEGYGPRYATRPCVVVEVLSPSTAATDTREKRLAYRRVESIRAYLIVYQDKVLVECHTLGDSGEWRRDEITLGGTIRVPCPVADIPIEEFYTQVPHLLVEARQSK
jgi:Uma2 family endonuclease